MTIRVGLVGCGGIAGMHVKGYRAAEGVKICACTDVNLERAKLFSVRHEIPDVYDTYEDMLANAELDAISVCTPNYAHCGPTTAALRAGVNVLCEKPIAMNSEEALLMVEAARDSGKLLSIGHHLRFAPHAQFLKRVIDAGDLGSIYYGRSAALRRRGVPGWGEFHIKSKSGGGPLIDIGVHTLDLIIWLMGSPSPRVVSGSVYTQFGNRHTYFNPHGVYRREDYDVEDFACALVKFSNGSSLTLEASWAAHIPEEEHSPQLILGDRGGAQIIPFGEGVPLRIQQSREEALLDITPTAFAKVEPHVEELKHWAACLRGEKEVLVRAEESLNVQRIIDAIYLSSQEGREIAVEEIASLSGEGSGKVGSTLQITPFKG